MSGGKSTLRRIGQILPLVLLVGAAWLLYREVRKYDWREVLDSFAAIPPLQVAASLGMMALNYAILVGYDWLALHAIQRRLPLTQVSLASFVGHTTSYNFGALLGGTTVRYRFYSSWGLTAAEIVRLVAMLAVTFWFGVFALAGTLFVLDPIPTPAEPIKLPGDKTFSLPGGSISTLGWGLLAMTAVYLALVFFWRRPLRWKGHELRLPEPGIAVAQLLVAAVDLTAAAGCAYFLMPADFHLSFPEFLSIYLLAVVIVVLSHVPGGVGVLEVTVLTFVGAQNAQVVAGILAFRVVYYLLPLCLAACSWGVYELFHRSSGGPPAPVEPPQEMGA